MSDDRKKVMVEHPSFDWGEIEDATLKQAGNYLLKLAETLPAGAVIEDHTLSYDPIDIRVVSYRDETDEEYNSRKEHEAFAAKLAAEQQKREKELKKKQAEYEKLKRELGHS